MDIFYKININSLIISIIKIYFFSLYTYFTTVKITYAQESSNKNKIVTLIAIFIISIIYSQIRNISNFTNSIIFLIFAMAILVSKSIKDNLGCSLIATIISIGMNYILFFISATISYFLRFALRIQENAIILVCIIVIYTFLVYIFFKIRRFKYGISFLTKNIQNEGFEMILLNTSIIIVFILILLSNTNKIIWSDAIISFIMFAIVMFITIQKSLQLYYKQKLLVQDLENTKKELAEKTKEIENLEAENIAISKKAHTLDHKQKSLAKKIDEMMMNTEISKEEVAEVKERLNKIGQDLYKEKTTVELSKTEIPEIDDMLSYMQSECSANKIDFELQIKGNIHYMTNNLITIEDLETLLADHIKNAIIAINHTDNINRSILVRLGEIDGIYSLYIYDSGIEFAKETLENLGKKPSTTHADEGGTGMGFMNTFDTLRKCKASLIIEELNEPSKDNYTKAIIIKFDNKNEFKIIHKKCYNCG